jgi:formylglycine-generating enzyme
VEAGIFQMGSTSGFDNEAPIHTVTISRSYYMSKYEVTFEQYDAYCDDVGKDKPVDRDLRHGTQPVYPVSWYNAVEYCNWLSRKEGLTPAYTGSGENIRCDFTADGYRLPTEAEWEYAARGGNMSRNTTYAGGNVVEDIGWYLSNTDDDPRPVGQKLANELELYDMSGNMWEWCWDRFGNYSSSSRTDPTGPDSGSERVIRGGCFNDFEDLLRVTSRLNEPPSTSYNKLGFRPVRTAQ